MDDQPALDNGPIPGHSLFTGTLIKAIDDGQADGEKKGFVTSSELALYLQQTVGSSSESRQTPDFGSFQFDDRGELVISLRGDTFNKAQARECLEVAQGVYELGWITGDPKRFSSAIREYRRAIEFAGLAKADIRNSSESEVNPWPVRGECQFKKPRGLPFETMVALCRYAATGSR